MAMTDTQNTPKQLLAGLENYPEAKSRPDWLEQWQSAELSAFTSSGFPSRKDEGWKYINLESVLSTSFSPSPQVNQIHVQAEVVQKYLLDGKDQADVLLINGQWVSHSKIAGVSVSPLGLALSNDDGVLQQILNHPWERKNAFTSLNNAYFHDGVVINIAADAVLEQPLQIVHLMTTPDNKPLVFFPRIIVHLQNGAKASVVLSEIDLGSTRYFNNQVIDVALEANSNLTWVNVQRGGVHGIHFNTLHLNQDSGSKAHFTDCTNQGALTRHETITRFSGEDASADFNGISLLTEEAQAFHHLFINHAVPRCLGRQLYKNILNGRARAEYNSLVHIERGAIHSDSGQLNRNMVLTKSARAWTRPQLQVYCDDVKAAHGATVGQVSPEELFYLRSRGLDEASARAMLIYGFAEEVVMNIPDLQIQKYLERFIKADLYELTQDASYS